MAVEAKGTQSRRKQDLKDQLKQSFGFVKTIFAHQANSGDVGINLNSLVAPSQMLQDGFVQPAFSTLAALHIYQFKNNVSIISSAHGVLQPYQNFVIASDTQINFVGFTASSNEVFVVVVDPVPIGGINVVSGQPLTVTGTLAPGQSIFNVGTPFPTNFNPSQQIGALLVTRNGIVQLRNTGNVAPSLLADGNFQDVPTLGGSSSAIQFNIPASGPNPDVITVTSIGVLVNNPQDSLMALIQSLQGQINSMVPVLAAAAGVPQSQFGGQPSGLDLLTFGKAVQTLQQLIQPVPQLISTLTTEVDTNPSAGVYVDFGLQLTVPAGLWDIFVLFPLELGMSSGIGNIFGSLRDISNNVYQEALGGTASTTAGVYQSFSFTTRQNLLVPTTFKCSAKWAAQTGSPTSSGVSFRGDVIAGGGYILARRAL